MDLKNKKTILCIAILCWAIVTILALLIARPGKPQTSELSPLGGLMNPNNITDAVPITKDELNAKNADKSEISLASEESMIERAKKELSRGAFSSLDSYLQEIEGSYRDNEKLDNSAMRFIERERGDLAMITGITSENGDALLQTFMTSEVLASAMVYLPISVKYMAYIHVDSIVVPAIEPGTFSDLKRIEDFEIETNKLAILNKGREHPFVETAIYTVTLFEKQYELTLVLQDNGFWAPYSLTTDDTTDVLNVQQVKKIAESIVNTGNSIDDMISYQRPDTVHSAVL